MQFGYAGLMCRRTIPMCPRPTRNLPNRNIVLFITPLHTRWKPFLSGASTSFQQRFIHNKAVQLNLAGACGLRVPETLLSNSPGRIREFVGRNPSRTIGKGFSPHVWQRNDENGVSVTETFKLTPELLPSDEVLTYAPGIYQEMVVKQFDIRMVIMGHKV